LALLGSINETENHFSENVSNITFGFFLLSSYSCPTLVPRVENFDPALNYVNIWTSTISITIPKNLISPFGEEETGPEEKALRVLRVRTEKIVMK